MSKKPGRIRHMIARGRRRTPKQTVFERLEAALAEIEDAPDADDARLAHRTLDRSQSPTGRIENTHRFDF